MPRVVVIAVVVIAAALGLGMLFRGGGWGTGGGGDGTGGKTSPTSVQDDNKAAVLSASSVVSVEGDTYMMDGRAVPMADVLARARSAGRLTVKLKANARFLTANALREELTKAAIPYTQENDF